MDRKAPIECGTKEAPLRELALPVASRLISRANCNYHYPIPLFSVDFPRPSIHPPSSHHLAGLDTRGSPQAILGHVSGLMSSPHAWRAFAPSSSLDPVRQHKDRQRKMSSYFAGGLPYSRYLRWINSIF